MKRQNHHFTKFISLLKFPGLQYFVSARLVLIQVYLFCSTEVLPTGTFRPHGRKRLWCQCIKKGNRSLLTNYRPIALLSAVGKVYERLVQVQLQKPLSTCLSDNQSGFRKGDSTSHQLFRLVQTWSDALDSRKLVGVVFFDLAKAFAGTQVSLPNSKLLACAAVLWTGLLATYPTELSK